VFSSGFPTKTYTVHISHPS